MCSQPLQGPSPHRSVLFCDSARQNYHDKNDIVNLIEIKLSNIRDKRRPVLFFLCAYEQKKQTFYLRFRSACSVFRSSTLIIRALCFRPD